MHALFGSYDLLKLRNASGQLGSRAVTIHFSRYRPDNTEDLKSFADAALSLASRMILPIPVELKDEDLDYCFDISLGIIGLLKVWFTDGLGLVLENGGKTLTRKDLEICQPPVDVLNKISLEIQKGEQKLAQDESLLNVIKLRLESKTAIRHPPVTVPELSVTNEDQPDEVDNDTENKPQSKKATGRRQSVKKVKAIERNPTRDNTGGGRKKRAA